MPILQNGQTQTIRQIVLSVFNLLLGWRLKGESISRGTKVSFNIFNVTFLRSKIMSFVKITL